MSIGARRLQRSNAATQATFYVDAKNGNDANIGTSRMAPLASIAQAYRLAQIRAATITTPITIALRGGTYRQSTPLTIGSIPNDVPITLFADANEKPVISGSIPMTGWSETTIANGMRAWTVSVGTDKTFKSLFVNGASRVRPRLPATCHEPLVTHTSIDRATQLYHFDTRTTSTDAPSFIYQANDIDPSWTNLTDIAVIASQQWISERMPLVAVTASNHNATVAYRPDGFPSAWNANTAYYIENVKEGLAIPGQWYHDRSTGVLTYLPKPGETLNNSTITIPVTTQLLTIENARNLTFDGITFTETDWDYLTSCTQGANGCPGIITTASADAITFRDCTVHDVGYAAFQLRYKTTNSLVTGCTMYNLGSGGVIVTSQENNYATHHNTVVDNHIHHGGMYFHQSCGLLIQDVHDVTAARNTIHDFFYSGISVG